MGDVVLFRRRSDLIEVVPIPTFTIVDAPLPKPAKATLSSILSKSLGDRKFHLTDD